MCNGNSSARLLCVFLYGLKCTVLKNGSRFVIIWEMIFLGRIIKRNNFPHENILLPNVIKNNSCYVTNIVFMMYRKFVVTCRYIFSREFL